jgi:hypothetical protein
MELITGRIGTEYDSDSFGEGLLEHNPVYCARIFVLESQNELNEFILV